MNIFRRKQKKESQSPVKKNSSTDNKKTNTDDENSFRQRYFNANKLYFSNILGDRLTNRSQLIDSDIALLKEAYEKAHQKVQFEIDLHWKRTTHVWTLIIALLVASGTIVISFLNSPDKREIISYLMLLFFPFCLVITMISTSLIRLSSAWCKNWELHVVMLEPLFSGQLYQTHLGMGPNRLSMTKLNSLFIWVAYTGWGLILQASIFFTFRDLILLIIYNIMMILSFFIISIMISFFITSKDKLNMPFEITKYGIKITPVKGNSQRIISAIKETTKKFIAIIFTGSLIISGLCIFILYQNKIKTLTEELNKILDNLF